MVDVSIVNNTSPEANWNGQTGRQTDRQANLCVGRLRLQKQTRASVFWKMIFIGLFWIPTQQFLTYIGELTYLGRTIGAISVVTPTFCAYQCSFSDLVCDIKTTSLSSKSPCTIISILWPMGPKIILFKLIFFLFWGGGALAKNLNIRHATPVKH